MVDKIIFAISQYAIFAAVLIAWHGIGFPIVRGILISKEIGLWITCATAIITGMSVMIIVLFFAGLVSALNIYTLSFLLMAGWGVTAFKYITACTVSEI